MDGILNIKKERGYTSHDVVAKLRGIIHQKKIGHTGTLDPDAVGVLPVCLGKATKVCEFLTDKRKTYVADVRLGVITDTQDMTGTVLKQCSVQVTEDQLRETLSRFAGEIWQTPPMYSAVKVNGTRLYELARQGKEVERKPRKITVFSLELLGFETEKNEFTIQVECSKGTYIRTLCQDIGEELACGAAMASLTRTQSGQFGLADAVTLDECRRMYEAGTLEEKIVPIDQLFIQYPAGIVESGGMGLLLNGNTVPADRCVLPEELEDKELVRMYDRQRHFYALYQFHADSHMLSCHKIFYNEVPAG